MDIFPVSQMGPRTYFMALYNYTNQSASAIVWDHLIQYYNARSKWKYRL